MNRHTDKLTEFDMNIIWDVNAKQEHYARDTNIQYKI